MGESGCTRWAVTRSSCLGSDSSECGQVYLRLWPTWIGCLPRVKRLELLQA